MRRMSLQIEMQQVVEALTSDYLFHTPDLGFQSLVAQETRYFRSRRVTAKRFEMQSSGPLEPPVTLSLSSGGQKVQAISKDLIH